MSKQSVKFAVHDRLGQIERHVFLEPSLRNEKPRYVQLKERMKYYKVPGVSLAIINEGKIEFSKSYGLIDSGEQRLIKPETLFQAASISKPVTAFAVMRLVEMGKLNLDVNVNTYLKSWRVPANSSWQPNITLRQILCHGAGVTQLGFPGYLKTEPIPTLLAVLNGEGPVTSPPIRIDMLPGLQYRYSGGGYCILEQVLIDHLGKSFPQLMKELVFDPLNMDHSTFEQPLPQSSWNDAASGHGWMNLQSFPGDWAIYPQLAAAGLWSIPSDLARFLIEIQMACKGKSPLLKEETCMQMLTPQIDVEVGLGFFLEGENESFRFRHGGSNQGFQCHMIAYLETQCGAVVMTNADSGVPLINEILCSIAKEYKWSKYLVLDPHPIESDPTIFGLFSGIYELETGSKIVISNKNSNLILICDEQEPIILYPVSQTTFMATSVNLDVTFQLEKNNLVSEIVLIQDEQTLTARKLD